MRVQVLGPLAVTTDGHELSLGGRQQRLVLALLVTANGRAVSTGQLIDGVWGENVPPTARKALQGYVHHLRAEIGGALKTEIGGYSFDVADNIDAVQFAAMHDRATKLLEVDPMQASELLREGLGLWNGPAYADLREEHALLPEVARLENLRIAALGDRIDADLTRGRHEGLIGELEGLTYEYPFQERFRAQHMTALYRAGRQVEALRSYERMRLFLAEETGLEPSAEIQRLEERILAQDESLLVGERMTLDGPAAVRGYELREKIATGRTSETYRAYQRSVGRQVAIKVLAREIADDPEFIANFLADTGRIAAIEHPHIAFVFDTWREPGRAYQVSRWLGGGSLSAALRSKSFGLRSALRILEEVGGALSHAHRRGVVHGRVDASNVLLDESGHAYLSGFAVGVPAADATADGDRLQFAALAHLLLSSRMPVEADGSYRTDLGDTDVAANLAPAFDVAFGPEGYGRVEDFLRALRRAAGADVVEPLAGAARIDTRNPYKGLQAFQEADAGDFYGRSGLVDELVAVLEGSRLLAVVGPSGSGKSSVVKAGLMSRLREASDGTVLVSEMYPGAFPFEELETALLRIGVNRSGVIDDLLGDDRGLVRVLKQILPSEDSELVLVIDQFEELFSLVTDERVRQLFLHSLVNAVTDPHSRLRVVVTMRADFFDRPLHYPDFGEIMKTSLVPVTALSEEELARAVAQPARSVGVEFEPGLVSQIVRDVSEQPGGLPLLQYAVTRLFEDRDTDVLTLTAYQRSGGVLGALGRRAEELYRDLSPAARRAARHAFLRMVTVDESADDLRRRIRRSELSAAGIEEAALNDALQAFGAHRLLTFDRDPVTRGPTVEVAHEALLREWYRLRGWVEEQRDDLVMRKRLTAALEEWQQADEDDSYLPSGGRLAQFADWAAGTTLALTPHERAFLESGRLREASAAAAVAARRRRLTIGLAGVATVLAALAAFAFVERRNAEDAAADAAASAQLAQDRAEFADEQRRVAEEQTAIAGEHAQRAEDQAAIAQQETQRAEEQAALAEEQTAVAGEQGRRSAARALAFATPRALAEDADRALLYALAAGHATTSAGEAALPEAVEALHRALGGHRIALRLPAGGGSTVAWNDDGSRLLTAPGPIGGAEATIWSLDGEALTTLGGDSRVTGAEWSADGHMIVTTHESGEITLWDAASLLRLGSLQGEWTPLKPVLDPTGRFLAVAEAETPSADGTRVRVWDLVEMTDRWSVTMLFAGTADFSPDGSRVALAHGNDFVATVHDTETGRVLWSIPTEAGAEQVAFDPTGRFLAVLEQSKVMVWDVASETVAVAWDYTSRFPHTLAWSPDGKLIAVAGHSRVVDVYDAETGRKRGEYAGHTAATIRWVAFAPNTVARPGGPFSLASTDDSGLTLVWDLDPVRAAQYALVPVDGFRSGYYLGGETEAIVGTRPSGDVFAVELDPPYGVRQYPGDTADIWSAYNTHTDASGEIAVTSMSDEGGFAVFDPQTMEVIREVATYRVIGLSPDGTMAAAFDPTATLPPVVINVGTGAVIAELGDPRKFLHWAAFTPDGSLVAIPDFDDATFRVFEIATGRTLLERVVSPDSAATATSFSPEGSLLVLVEESGLVTVISVAELVAGAPESDWLLASFEGLSGSPSDAEFHPDGSLLAVAGTDDSINFWNTADWSLAYSIPVELNASINRLDFNGDGTELLASVVRRGLLRVPLYDGLVGLALERVTRGFTADECRTLDVDPCPATLEAVHAMYGG